MRFRTTSIRFKLCHFFNTLCFDIFLHGSFEIPNDIMNKVYFLQNETKEELTPST